MTPEEVLHQTFSLSGFRPGQAEVVQAQLEGRDVLSVAPTGSGKSISYWVPALIQDGLTVVVSPLIALMKDQVDHLQSHGVAAAFINSSLDRQEQWRRLQAARAGQLKLLYLAPERLSREGFVGVLQQLPVARFVIDEAHCISTWGHDFRPDYRLLGQTIESCGRPPVAAFTATATPQVQREIVQCLGLKEPFISITGFNRSNLRLEALRCRNDEQKRGLLRERLAIEAGRVLIYCATVRAVEELAGELRGWGHPGVAYHAQLDDHARSRVQEDFAGNRCRIVVATTAFGMGIDIPDIRQVIHFQLPSSLEGYYQEAGRAGRDGQPAYCLLLWRPGDSDIQSFLIERGYEQAEPGQASEDGRRHAYVRLQAIKGYASLRSCRHARIAHHFGESTQLFDCQNCDNCLAPDRLETQIDPAEVRIALQAIVRHNDQIGAANLAAILSGVETRWLRDRPWAMRTPGYGALGEWPQPRIRELLAELLGTGLIKQSPSKYPTLMISSIGREVIDGHRQPEIFLPNPPPKAEGLRQRASSGGSQNNEVSFSNPLFNKLREWRLAKAKECEVPAFVIFPDRTLVEIAARRPPTVDALLAVPGVGPIKLERFGQEVLQLVEAFAA